MRVSGEGRCGGGAPQVKPRGRSAGWISREAMADKQPCASARESAGEQRLVQIDGTCGTGPNGALYEAVA